MELETVEEFLKKPLIYVPRKYIKDLEKLADKLPSHKLIDDEKKPSVVFEFENLAERDRAKSVSVYRRRQYIFLFYSSDRLIYRVTGE